ncbi:MAG: hypothetical protein ACI4KF_03195 [Huintestinicola sp.]
MQTKKNAAGILMALSIVFAMIFSFSFIALESGHDCTGEDCPICEAVVHCEEAVQTLGTAETAVFALFTAVYAIVIAVCRPIQASCVQNPIKLKVKLSN